MNNRNGQPLSKESHAEIEASAKEASMDNIIKRMPTFLPSDWAAILRSLTGRLTFVLAYLVRIPMKTNFTLWSNNAASLLIAFAIFTVVFTNAAAQFTQLY